MLSIYTVLSYLSVVWLFLGYRPNCMDMRLYVFVLFYLCTVYLTNILCMLLLESVSDPSEQVYAFIFFCLQHLCLTSLFFYVCRDLWPLGRSLVSLFFILSTQGLDLILCFFQQDLCRLVICRDFFHVIYCSTVLSCICTLL